MEVSDEEAVDPHGAGVERGAHAVGPHGVTGDESGCEPEAGVVSHRDGLGLVGEGLQGEHGAEDLLGENLAPGLGPYEQGRSVVQPAEVGVGASPDDGLGPVGDRPADEPVDPVVVGSADHRSDVRVRLARVALLHQAGSGYETRLELVGNRILDEEPDGGQAHLAGVVVLLDGEGHREVEVGVREDHER